MTALPDCAHPATKPGSLPVVHVYELVRPVPFDVTIDLRSLV